MTSWVKRVLESTGYAGVVLLMFVENVFPPIPSEVVMPYAGFVASRGELILGGVVLAGSLGSVLGALPLYYAGRWVEEERLKRWAAEHGHWLMLKPRDVEKAERWFDRHATLAVFLGRMVPGVRSLISIPAGFTRMNLARFLFWTFLGTTLWAALLGGLGAFLGDRYEVVGRWTGPVSWLVLGGLLVWYVVYVWRNHRLKHRSKRRARAEGEQRDAAGGEDR